MVLLLNPSANLDPIGVAAALLGTLLMAQTSLWIARWPTHDQLGLAAWQLFLGSHFVAVRIYVCGCSGAAYAENVGRFNLAGRLQHGIRLLVLDSICKPARSTHHVDDFAVQSGYRCSTRFYLPQREAIYHTMERHCINIYLHPVDEGN